MTRTRATLVAALLLAVAALAVVYLLAQDLFVFKESRAFILANRPLDLGRFFLFPELAWGDGRLAGVATFQLTRAVCSVEATCTNAIDALLVAACVVALVVHTRQLTRSLAGTSAIAMAWIISAPVLAIAFWQSTRFDSLGFLTAIGASAIWFRCLGMRSIPRLGAVAFVLGSVLLLALAFNSKEANYYLVGTLLFFAIIRVGTRSLRVRNLALVAVPILYAFFFIGWALTHTLPAYAAVIGGNDLATTVLRLITQALALGHGFMFVRQGGDDFEAIHLVAIVLYSVFVVSVLATAVWAWRHSGRPRIGGGRPRIVLLRQYAPEFYTLAIAGGLTFMGARSQGAAVYYLALPYWAALVFGYLVLRRLARRTSRPSLALKAGLVLFGAAALVAYTSHLVPRSTYRQLTTASASMFRTGATIKTLLTHRSVNDVTWRTEGSPATDFYMLGGLSPGTAGWELWSYLVQDQSARPVIQSLTEGDAETLALRAADYGGPGRVLVVVGQDYRLRLLVHEGNVLYQEHAGT